MIELTQIARKEKLDLNPEYNDIKIEIEKTFQEYFNNPIRIQSLDLICDIYERGLRIGLDDYRTWEFIIDNSTIFNHKLFFIYDTINFILYGKRDLTIENWSRLIDFNCIPEIQYQNVKAKEFPNVFKNIYILDEWIKRKNGVLDMLYTVYILSRLVSFFPKINDGL